MEPAHASSAPLGDDRVLAPTRWAARIIVPVLVAAFVILYGFPDRTADLWAWTIAAPMTAMAMGGGYLAGAWFFLRVDRTRCWHAVGHGVLATSFFATLLLGATLLHWDVFAHGHVSFWAWLILYLLTPALLPLLWAVNRRTDPGPAPGVALMPRVIRVAMVALGLVQAATAVQLFFVPDAAAAWWPWELTPLTARTMSAFVAFPAVMFLCAAIDGRWSSFRVPLEVAAIGVATFLVAAVRAGEEFRGPGVRQTFVAATAAGLAVTVGLRILAGRAEPRQDQADTSGSMP